MPRIESWQISHPTPYAPGLSEDVYGDLFRDVGRNEDGRQKYFANRASVLSANPSIAFDSTTILPTAATKPKLVKDSTRTVTG